MNGRTASDATVRKRRKLLKRKTTVAGQAFAGGQLQPVRSVSLRKRRPLPEEDSGPEDAEKRGGGEPAASQV